MGRFLIVSLAASDPRPSPEEIIQRFAAKEAEFAEVWKNYTYVQYITMEVLDRRGRATERQEYKVEVYFTTAGQRKTRILSQRGALQSVRVTDEDLEDALHRQPFVLTTSEVPHYEIQYEGEERVDELDTYVFDVKPRGTKEGKRYFKGRIWVDTQDLQIVKTSGKIVPDHRDNKFPKFETIREQIDGKYWFPTWTEADDVLRFGGLGGYRDVHVRELITYEDFKKFEVGTSITYDKPLEQ